MHPGRPYRPAGRASVARPPAAGHRLAWLPSQQAAARVRLRGGLRARVPGRVGEGRHAILGDVRAPRGGHRLFLYRRPISIITGPLASVGDDITRLLQMSTAGPGRTGPKWPHTAAEAHGRCRLRRRSRIRTARTPARRTGGSRRPRAVMGTFGPCQPAHYDHIQRRPQGLGGREGHRDATGTPPRGRPTTTTRYRADAPIALPGAVPHRHDPEVRELPEPAAAEPAAGGKALTSR